MTKRKIILIALDLFLLCVCIIQFAAGAKKTVKDFILKETPDELILTTPDAEIPMVLEDDKWFIGEKKYLAKKSEIEPLIETISSVKALDKLGSVNNETAVIRYELSEGKKITVVAKKAGKVLRTLEIGKEADAGTQCYATVDGGKDIYLLAGNVRMSFNKTIDRLRDTSILNFDKTLISQVSYTYSDGSEWSVSRTGSDDSATYSISGAEVELDPTKVNDLLDSFALLNTNRWHDENADLGGSKYVSIVFKVGSEDVTFDFFEIPAETDDGIPTYYGRSSVTPYTFSIQNYAVKRFLVKPEDLAK